MEDLLTHYSVTEIVIFLVLLAFAIKEAVTFIDWGKDRIKKYTDKDYKAKKEKEQLQTEVQSLEKFYEEKKRVDEGFARQEDTNSQILEKLNVIEKTLNEHIRVDDERNADSVREYILRFNMECVRGIQHTREDFIEVLTKINEYEAYCRAHSDYKNNRAELAISNVKRVYSERLQKDDFL